MNNTVEKKALSVAANLRKIRVYRGYSQEYLALKLEISQNAYSKIELGYSNLNLKKLIHLALVLEVDPSFLFEEELALTIDTVHAE